MHQHESPIGIHMSAPPWTSPHLPSHPTPLGITEHWVELPAAYSKFPLATYFTYGNVYVSMLLSQFLPLSPPLCVHKSILYFCISITALQIGSWRADSSGRKVRIKKKMLLLHKQHFLHPTLSPTTIWSLWGWYLWYKLFTGDSLVLNKYLPNEWMNDQILPLSVFSLRRQEPALLKIIQQVCFEGWLSTQFFWWKAHPLSTKTC